MVHSDTKGRRLAEKARHDDWDRWPQTTQATGNFITYHSPARLLALYAELEELRHFKRTVETTGRMPGR